MAYSCALKGFGASLRNVICWSKETMARSHSLQRTYSTETYSGTSLYSFRGPNGLVAWWEGFGIGTWG